MPAPEERIRELEAEIERLTRVNDVLMDRVERSTDSAGSSYSLFESNLLLLEKIKEHTGRLEHVNRDLQREIRNRKQTEQDLRWERNFVDAVLEAAGALILVLDTEGRIVRFNRTCEEISGRRFEEVEGTPRWDLLPPGEIARVREAVDRLAAGSGPGEGENHWISVSGEHRLIAWSNTTVDDAEGEVEYIVSIGIDITEMRKAEEKLKLYRRIFMSTSDGIFITNPEERMVEWNPAQEEYVRRTDGRVVGRSYGDIFSLKEAPAIGKALGERGRFRGEVGMEALDGTTRDMDLSIFPVRSDGGELLHYVGMGRDITEIRRTQRELEEAYQELQDAQAQLFQSEKMAALGMLVAGIAHEINTPVGAVGSSHNTQVRALSKLRDRINAVCSEEPDHRKVVSLLKVIEDASKVIDTGVQRVTTIVRRLRTFARLDEAEVQESNIHECLEDTLMLVHHELKHDITVHRHFGDLSPIRCYPGRLNQVFLNLLINAKQAINGKGEITITTTRRQGWVEIAFADTGCGIEEEKLKKIFDPGFTTKGVGVGTGLGLSICYRLVQDHFGEIKVETRGCDGSTFTVVLPTDLKERLQLEKLDRGDEG